MNRLLTAAVIALLPLTTLPALTSTADAAVKNPRTIEVFYERDLLLLKGYPTDSDVLVEVYRGDSQMGSFTGAPADHPEEGPGFLEINHTGGADCWQGPNTPDIVPGDEVRTTIVDDPADQDFTITRNVSIDFDATVFDPGSGTANDGSITLSGVAAGTTTAPINPNDVLELRLNKVNDNNTWDTGPRPGRRDLREDLLRSEIGFDGRYTHTFSGLTQEDVVDARDNGVDQILEWSLPSADKELTVFDANEGVPEGCPPLGSGDPVGTTNVTSTDRDFGNEFVGAATVRSVTLRNGGTSDEMLTGFTVSGTHPGDYEVLPTSTCSTGATLAPGGTCEWSVEFAPSASGLRTAAILTSTQGGGQVRSDLRGTGVGRPTLRVNNVDIREGNGNRGTKTLVFSVTRSGDTSARSSVSVATANGNFPNANATVANNDYEAVPSRALQFAVGQSTKTVGVTINGDTRVEPDERFRLLLSGASQATIADNTGIGTILNND